MADSRDMVAAFCASGAVPVRKIQAYVGWACIKFGPAINQKSLGVHEILVCKTWFNTPPKGPKMRKNSSNQQKILKIDAFFRGGGDAFLWTQRFYGHLGVSEFLNKNQGFLAKRFHAKRLLADPRLRSAGLLRGSLLGVGTAATDPKSPKHLE